MKNLINRLLILLFIPMGYQSFAQQEWIVPKQAKFMENPIVNDTKSRTDGAKIYKKLCVACHGIDGKGDPVAIKAMHPRPADFSIAFFQNQSDGTIYWKITKGRGIMAAYESMLTETQRWEVINYLRTFKTPDQINKNVISKEKDTVNIKEKTSIPKKISETKTKIYNPFPFTKLINTQTTHIIQPKGFGLTIQHRFAATKFNKEFIDNFMGLDLAANMRFGFEIPISKKLYVEIGRTRYGKYYDIGAKYLIYKQTDKMPFAIAIYENIAITTEKSKEYTEGSTFEDGSSFAYTFKHRLMYDTQIIMARQFSNKFSAQLTGEFIWRNLTPYSIKPKEKSFILAFPISLRYKFGLLSAIDIEIMPNTEPKNMPLSLAYEVASSGNHVFQITITNSDRILSQNIFTHPTLHYPKDGFMLGFNLIRYF